jgi:DNA-binding MarR family transcriptional regulator
MMRDNGGVSGPEMETLVSIARDGPATIEGLARRSGDSVATIARRARRLVVSGLAIHVPAPVAGAAPLLVASTSGRAVALDLAASEARPSGR